MSFWQPHRINALRKLWQQGRSTQDIADIIGDGCTKNMVISKSRRLRGCERRPSPLNRMPPCITGTIDALLETSLSETDIARMVGRKRQTVSRYARRQGWVVYGGNRPKRWKPREAKPSPVGCEWMHGEPRAAKYCNAEKVPGKPYCEAHCKRAYRALPKKTGGEFRLPGLPTAMPKAWL